MNFWGFRPGDHLAAKRWGYLYEHHGLFIGDNKVIHWMEIGEKKARIDETDFQTFANGRPVRRIDHPGRLHDPQKSIRRAEECRRDPEGYKRMLGQASYNLATNNCEHFVNWCIEGEKRSAQVRDYVTGAAVGAGAGVAEAIAEGDCLPIILAKAGIGIAAGLGLVGGGKIITRLREGRPIAPNRLRNYLNRPISADASS